jgi:S1-C subfamily serine protease
MANDKFMGVLGEQKRPSKDALPPPQKNASLPTYEQLIGNGGGRKVQDNFVNKVVASCGPAIVRIDTEHKAVGGGELDADIFSFFFGVRPEQQDRKVQGHGSGFCIDPSGIILTNSHVVQDQDRIFVTFPDRTRLEATVLGTDDVIDLAALQVAPKGKLPSVRLGSSAHVKTGDWGIVLGNPLGLNNTCTLGIISSLDRSSGETGWDWMRHPLLQTDAAVNQGNSGGPLINEAGEVIGVISMRALFGEGIGFAIPVDSAKQCLQSLLKRKDVPHAFMGLKLGTNEGKVVVQAVLDGTPAAHAGVKTGDVIEEVGGQSVKRQEQVQKAVRNASPGQTLQLKTRRGGKSSRVDVRAGDVKHLKELKEKQQPAQSRILVIPRSK